MLLAEGQKFCLRFPVQDAEFFLDYVQLSGGFVIPQYLKIYIGGADGPDLALLLHPHELTHGLGHGHKAIGHTLPVSVININIIRAKCFQAQLQVPADCLGGQVPADLMALPCKMKLPALVIPLDSALGGKDHLMTGQLLKGLPHHLLTVSKTVHPGSVHPVDAQIQCPTDGLNGHPVIIVPPPKASANGPAAQAQAGGLYICFTNLPHFHTDYSSLATISPYCSFSFLINASSSSIVGISGLHPWDATSMEAEADPSSRQSIISRPLRIP